MDVLAKGQLSYMILSCLSERDMYGLELIEEIKKKYGRDVKLPSLYSNLNRMKELKYISSYLRESLKGPKCSYSSITENGREALEKLRVDFGGLSKVEELQPQALKTTPLQENFSMQQASVNDENEDVDNEYEQTDDYSDYFNLDEQKSELDDKKDETFDKISSDNDLDEEKFQKREDDFVESKKLDEKFGEKQESDEPKLEVDDGIKDADYNRKIYNISRDFSKNRNKKSYTENQIQLNISPAPFKSSEKQDQDLSAIKQALLNSKEGNYEEIRKEFKTYNTLQSSLKQETKQSSVKDIINKEIEEQGDDGVFITDRLPEDAIPKPKRIEPPRLNIILATPGYDKKLPAPKRDVSTDPTCNDVRAKIESLYAKAEVKKEVSAEINDFENYEDLADYYKSQGVNFKIYERPEARPRHNTNLLNLYVSLFIFSLISIGSALMYAIFTLCKMTTASTNFVYYLFPIIALVYVIYSFYNYKTTVSKVPKPMWHPAVVWSLFALFVALIFLINYACGVSFNTASTYFSTILFPIYVSACATLGVYYSQIYVYKRFWK